MHWNLALGCLLMFITTVIHAGGMIVAFKTIGMTQFKHWALKSTWTRVVATGCLVLLLFLTSVVEAAIWAAAYVLVDAMEGFQEALYFSTVTLTTLGYGDLVLPDRWRLLSSFEAATGTIMFGWTTAMIFAAVHRFFVVDRPGASREVRSDPTA